MNDFTIGYFLCLKTYFEMKKMFQLYNWEEQKKSFEKLGIVVQY